jgi:hypothetical protein
LSVVAPAPFALLVLVPDPPLPPTARHTTLADCVTLDVPPLPPLPPAAAPAPPAAPMAIDSEDSAPLVMTFFA